VKSIVWKVSRAIAIAVSTVLAGCGGGLPARLQPIPTLQEVRNAHACHGWRVIPSANGSLISNDLYGVARSSGSTLWAVGSYESKTYAPFLTLTERWNGRSWSIVPSPNDGSGDNSLSGVAAISQNDVWAVGIRNATPSSQTKSLIEHWNGSAWSVVRSPSAGQLSVLGAVAAVSSKDVWAVGSFFNFSGNQQTLVEHWNGSKWSIVKSPSPGASYNGLGGLAVVSPKNIWATGSLSSDGGNTSQTLVERWNGAQWNLVSSPNVPGAIYNGLGGIASIGARDLWAVGESESPPTHTTHTLIERWSGARWSIVASPNVGTGGNAFAGIAYGPGGDLWAVGSYVDTTSFLNHTLTERWNGSAWVIVKSPNPGSNVDQLSTVTSNAGGFWAVGAQSNSQGGRTLVEFHC
jgi:hypothetical protein